MERQPANQIIRCNNRLFDSLVLECWLPVREIPASIPSQGPRHTKDVIKMTFWHLTLNGRYGSFLRIKKGKKKKWIKSGMGIL